MLCFLNKNQNNDLKKYILFMIYVNEEKKNSV